MFHAPMLVNHQRILGVTKDGASDPSVPPTKIVQRHGYDKHFLIDLLQYVFCRPSTAPGRAGASLSSATSTGIAMLAWGRYGTKASSKKWKSIFWKVSPPVSHSSARRGSAPSPRPALRREEEETKAIRRKRLVSEGGAREVKQFPCSSDFIHFLAKKYSLFFFICTQKSLHLRL